MTPAPRQPNDEGKNPRKKKFVEKWGEAEYQQTKRDMKGMRELRSIRRSDNVSRLEKGWYKMAISEANSNPGNCHQCNTPFISFITPIFNKEIHCNRCKILIPSLTEVMGCSYCNIYICEKCI